LYGEERKINSDVITRTYFLNCVIRVERAVALASKPEIRVDDLPEYITNLSVETYRRRDSDFPTLEEQEKNYVKWVLNKCEGNKTQAAKIMGIDRVSLWRKIKRFEIDSEE
jgi:transcriptional regulator of acetoin/glycerol metabolism